MYNMYRAPWFLSRGLIIILAVLASGGVSILIDGMFLRHCLAGTDLLPADCWPWLFDQQMSWPSSLTESDPLIWFDEILIGSKFVEP